MFRATKWALNLARYSPSSECGHCYCCCSNCCYLKRGIRNITSLEFSTRFLRQNYSYRLESCSSWTCCCCCSPEALDSPSGISRIPDPEAPTRTAVACSWPRASPLAVSIGPAIRHCFDQTRKRINARQGSFLIIDERERWRERKIARKYFTLFTFFKLIQRLTHSVIRIRNTVLTTVIERVDRLQKFL